MSWHWDGGGGEGKVLGMVNGGVEGGGSDDVGIHKGAAEETSVAASSPATLIGGVDDTSIIINIRIHKSGLPVLPSGYSWVSAEDGLAGVKVHVIVEDLVALTTAD